MRTVIVQFHQVLDDTRRLQIRIADRPFPAVVPDSCIAHHGIGGHPAIGLERIMYAQSLHDFVPQCQLGTEGPVVITEGCLRIGFVRHTGTGRTAQQLPPPFQFGKEIQLPEVDSVPCQDISAVIVPGVLRHVLQTGRERERFQPVLVDSLAPQFPGASVNTVFIMASFSILHSSVCIDAGAYDIRRDALMLPQLTEEVKIQSRGETAFHLRLPEGLYGSPVMQQKVGKTAGAVAAVTRQRGLENIRGRIGKTVLHLERIAQGLAPVCRLFT